MRETLFTKQLRLLSIPIRLGLSLVLGTLTVLLLIGLVSVASPTLAPAGSPGPGELDTTFGGSGVVTTSISPGKDWVHSVAIQPDGKIVAAGFAFSGSDNDFAVVRYTVSGTPDITFGSGGVVTTPIGPDHDVAYGVTIQPDGKIVAAGYASNGSDDDLALVRYTVSGTPDTAFGSGGVVTTSIAPHNDRAYGVAIQSDGKIVAGGNTFNGSDFDFALVRYTASGMPDMAFGSGGVVTTPIGPGNNSAKDIAIQADGKIVAVGNAYSGSDNDFAVVRYTASGTPDTTFGSGGVVTTPIGPGNDGADGVAIQPDGKIVAVGYASNGSDDDLAVVRYTVSGTLDITFGSGGVVTTPIGPDLDYACAVAIQADGKIVAAGYTCSGSDCDFAVMRYTVSGTLDTTFGNGGVVTTSIGSGNSYGWSVAIQPDGKIVAGGYTSNGSEGDFALVRYHAGYAVYLPLVVRSH